MQGNKKIIITGGHATCALAVIDELQKNQHKCLIVFVGRRYVNADEHNDSFEYQEITARKIPFIHLETGRAMQFFKFISGLINSFSIVARHKPDTILSFGGYLALPIAIAGWILGVKIVTHEQTIEPGTANRIIGVIATKVCISFPETKKFFAKEKVVLTGNPLRTSIFKREEKFVLPKGRQSIYITGGSLGSHAINILIEEIIRDLLKKYTVVHQCGNIDEFGDYERLNKIRNSLSLEDKKHYLLKKHLMDNEIGDVYAKTDLVIGRSGANTFFELIALEKPSLYLGQRKMNKKNTP